MLYLVLITFGVFVLFWLGDLYLTLKTVKHLDKHVEVNPLIRGFLSGRGKLIYLVKPAELAAFLYLIWFLTKFEGAVPFYILLVFIFVYSMLVVNNAHVYYLVTKKDSSAFRVMFAGLTIAVLLFIYLNYLLYLDLGISYGALEKSNDKYNELYQQCISNSTLSKGVQDSQINLPEFNLSVDRGGVS